MKRLGSYRGQHIRRNTRLTVIFAIIGVATIASGVFIFTTDYDDQKIQTVYDYGERYITTPADSPVQTSMEDGGLKPEISFDFPAEVRLGQPFEVNIPYSYVGFDEEDGEVDWIIDAPVDDFYNHSSAWTTDRPGTQLVVSYYPEHLELLNEPDFDTKRSEYISSWQITKHTMVKFLDHDIAQEHNIKMKFNMTKPMEYPLEHFGIVFDFTPLDYWFNEDNGVYKPSLERDPPQFAPGAEPQPPCPSCGDFEVGPPPPDDYDMKRPDMESTRDILNSWGDEILEELPQYETLEDYLREGFADDWVEEFLQKYPEFKKQSANLDTVFNFLLPSAYGQSQGQLVSVSGKVLMQNKTGSYLAPSTRITACLVDENLALNNGTYTVLKNGLTDACKLVSADGSFSLVANNDDPDNTNSADKADLAIQFELKNDDIKHVKNMENHLRYYHTATMNNQNSSIVRFADEQIDKNHSFSKAFQVYDKINDGYKHFENLGYNDIPQVTLQYEPGDMSAGLSYSNSRIKLQDTSTKEIKDNPITILHEFGHHIQKHAYAKKSSTTPTCVSIVTHGANIPTHERCAWSEGWATFVGLWVEDVSQYQSFVKSNNVNFEIPTINGNPLVTTSPSKTEGWITAALLDIVDSTNEQHDDLTSEDQKLWNAFSNNKATQSSHNLVAGSIYEFQDDWNAESNFPSLQNIFFFKQTNIITHYNQ